jgi:hypothetical protein
MPERCRILVPVSKGNRGNKKNIFTRKVIFMSHDTFIYIQLGRINFCRKALHNDIHTTWKSCFVLTDPLARACAKNPFKIIFAVR